MLRDRFFADPAAVGAELGLERRRGAEPGADPQAPGRAVRRFAPAQAARPGAPGRPDRRAGRSAERGSPSSSSDMPTSQHRAGRRPTSTTRPGSSRRCADGPIEIEPPWAVDLARVRAGLATGHAGGPCPDHADVPISRRAAGDRQVAGADRAPDDPGSLVEANPAGACPARGAHDPENAIPTRVGAGLWSE